MLTISSVGRRFPNGTEALRDVSLRLGEGDFLALLGPSGCGKSTLLRLIAGLDHPDSGTLRWDAGSPPSPGQIGYVFQDATLLPWASAEDNVWLPLRLRGIGRSAARGDIASVLTQVGLTGFEAAHPSQLSGGMRMRVSIARALVTKPRLLLMDEPFAALDALTRRRMQDELLGLWEETRFTVLFVTHSIPEAVKIGNRILLMTPHPGQVKAELNSLDPSAAPGEVAMLEQRIHDMLFADRVEEEAHV
jgi:NitT/TauT family transport system ATP-binding protein